MPDFEPQQPPQKEVASPEQKTYSKLKTIAEQLGSHTRNVIDGIGEIGNKFLERTWYTHSASLLLLESIAVKTLSLVATPEISSKGKMIGVGFWTSGIAALLEEDVVKAIKDKVNVGNHMSIHLGHYRTPFGKELSDETVVRPGQKIGIIDILRNLPSLEKDENLLAITKKLYRESEADLRELAKMCQDNNPSLEGVEVFYGVSHLAGPLAKRLGFDVFDIANPLKRTGVTLTGKLIAAGYGWKNKQWREYQSKFKSAREAFISRKKLIELYGEKNPEEDQPQIREESDQ